MKHYRTEKLECDVCVAGGGMAGIAAAVAAARQGMRVILCQDRPVLGGNASSEVRMHIVGADSNRPAADLENEAREGGIVEEVRLENAVRNSQCSASMGDMILYELCRAEPTLTVLLNTTVIAAAVEAGAIRSVQALRTSTEDQFLISAPVFLDCTGDGGLGVAAGAEYFHGREGKAEYAETLAPDVADNKTLGSTLLFMARKHDKLVPFVAPPWARKFSAGDFKLRGCTEGIDNWEYGYWWIEWGGHLDTIRDNETIRDELLAIIMGVWDYIKNSGDHGADCWALDWFGFLPGKRESRRFAGQYMLKESDLLESRLFPDAIAYGGWPIDIHPVEGIDARDSPPAVQTKVPFLYDIPLRACISKNITNLMFAGRNISATHVAFASTRVMATCAAVGEGVGIAAAYAVRKGLRPEQLPDDASAIQQIQQNILLEDGFLIGKRLDESANLVSTGILSASGEQDESPVTNVLSGQNRALSGEGGVAPERICAGTHRWRSKGGLPAWIAVTWEQAVSIREISLTFDTGMHRRLTLTHAPHYFRKMHWGGGQPELVKSFSVEYLLNGEWKELCQVGKNRRRRFRHRLSNPLLTTALRVVVRETWGLPEARIIRFSVT